MKYFANIFRIAAAVTVTVLLAGCATNERAQREDLLVTAGFRNILATTPQQKTLLASLPPDGMSVVQKNGKTWYVYPNIPKGSAYVGTPEQALTFRNLAMAKRMSDRNLRASQMNGVASMDAWSGGYGW